MSADLLPSRFRAIARHNFVLLSRDPGQIVGYTITPMLMMIALRPIYAARGDEAAGTVQATIGPLVLFSLLTLNVIGHSVLNERTWRTWNRLRSTAATSVELLLGKCLPFFLMLLVQQTILVVFSAVVFDLRLRPYAVLCTAFVILLWSATILGFGALLATAARTHGQLNTITDIGSFVVTVVGGGLTPLANMPDWMRVIAPFSPGYWALDAYRHALNGDSLHDLAGPVLVLMVLCALATAGAASLTARRAGARLRA